MGSSIGSRGFQVGVRIGAALLALFGIAVPLCLFVAWNGAAPPSLDEARAAFRQRDFARAEQLADLVPLDSPLSASAALLAADAAERQKRYEAAVEHLEKIPDSARGADQVRIRCGDLLLGILRQPSRAEDQFRRALQIDPDSPEAHERLAFVLGLCASSWEATPHRLQLLKYDRYEAVHLFVMCVQDTVLENSEQIPALIKAAPDDPRALLAAARIAADRQDYAAARTMLVRAAGIAPSLVEVHVKLGQLLQEDASAREIAEWDANLPAGADPHPGIWAVRGTWAMSHGERDAAIRCFWECVRRDPNHERGNYQLSQLLLARQEPDRAQPFLTRSRRLNDYFNAVKIAFTGHDDQATLSAASIAEDLGLFWESGAWYRLLQKKQVLVAQSEAGLRRLAPRWPVLPLQRADPGVNPAAAVDLSSFPLPRWNEAGAVVAKTGPESNVVQRLNESQPAIAFSDDAHAGGLQFQYLNGAPLGTSAQRMYEFTGGGIAVLDYDADGYPDLYCAQGGAWPPGSGPGEPLDRLFRNQHGVRYADVTELAVLHEPGFSQGATAGDFDGDGFADLYVANIGRNRFFHNNGDGTFRDVTAETGTAGNDGWSTSCALADLNADGYPDLYVVKYLSGSDVFDRICPDVDGKPRSCSPRHFPAAQDQLFLNEGDGTFREITAESGIVVPDGKGLGVVVGDFDGSGRPAIFVANDAVPNFYFVNQARSPGAVPMLAEQAMAWGLAVDRDGRPQACMGVAAGDADGDGLLDLFATNFFNECNTLYRQSAAGAFEDATRSAHLYDVSLKMVGFGTQFLDADLDGREDLVLVNGDVDDLRDTGRDYAQRPQFLWNAGQGTFREIRGSAGSFFDKPALGRSLVRLDWNRDGQDDFAVSHLDVPVALLTNRTHAGRERPAANARSVSLRLIGTVSPREPIGATLQFHVGSERRMRQLTAGDGYMASNERLIVIGLGAQDRIDDLEIGWPSGQRTRLRSLAAGTRYAVIEGADRAIELRPDP